MATQDQGVLVSASAIEPLPTDTASPSPVSLELSDVGFTAQMASSNPIIHYNSSNDSDPVLNQIDEPPPPVDDSSDSTVLTPFLCNKIIKQAEYYFSDESLASNNYLMSYIKKGKDGFVPIGVIASFKKMRSLVTETSLIVDALKQSSQLVVSSSGKMVKRLHPLSLPDDSCDPKLCTILVENFPETHSNESLQNMFGEVGKIKDICIRYPNSSDELVMPIINSQTVDESKKWDMAANIIVSKVHAFIVYENVEAAEKAEATFNDKDNWRNGIRVRVLNKLMGRYNKQARTKGNSNTGTSSQNSGEGEDHNHGGGGDHAINESEKGGRRRQQQQQLQGGRLWRQNQHMSGGQGHGSVLANHEPAKPPPPRPRMPDGTKGFALGRGRPPMP